MSNVERAAAEQALRVAGALGMPGKILDTAGTRDLRPLVMKNGRLQVLPSSFWAGTTVEERAILGAREAIYGFPTVELVEYLKTLIGGRSAIEIGAGNGVLAHALGIRATDNRMQTWPKYQLIYGATGQKTIKYGANVQTYDAVQAVLKFKPQVVIGCWVTHKWDDAQQDGNADGIVEEEILAGCEEYIVIGTDEIHAKIKPIRRFPHTIEYHDFLYSRRQKGRDVIIRWPGRTGQK